MPDWQQMVRREKRVETAEVHNTRFFFELTKKE